MYKSIVYIAFFGQYTHILPSICTLIGRLRYFQFENLNRPIRMHKLPFAIQYTTVDQQKKYMGTDWYGSIIDNAHWG